MIKPPCHFHFTDEPQRRTQDSRAHAAHLLRAWRAHPERCAVTRCSPGVYLVVASNSSAVAILETR
jgi:hypothetical protein